MGYQGKVWIFGDDVDTDVIIPAHYLNTIDPQELAKHCMEVAEPDFYNKVQPGDIMVAGKNFGCGSSREHAPIAIKAAEISCIIARSYARIFYRNSFNVGLPIFESPTAVDAIQAGDEVEVDPGTGIIRNLTRNEEYRATPVPEFMQQIIDAGGLISYVAERIKK